MPVSLVSEDELRAALRPYQVDPATFEAGVRKRIEAAQAEPAEEPFARLSPLLRSAAAFLPLEVLAGCKGAEAAAKLAPVAGGYKLLSYVAFPAISLFVLLSATIFSISKIRSIHGQTGSGLSDQEAIYEATREWWRRHKWGAIGVFAATLTLMVVGATWILFLFYLISFGLLLFVLASFAKVGVGNRLVIGRSCMMGLMFLGQVAMMSGIGDREIHFLDQQLASAIFLGGVLILLPFAFGGFEITGRPVEKIEKTPRWFWGFIAVFWLVQLLLIAAVWSFLSVSPLLRVLLVAILAVGALVPLGIVFRARMAGRWIGSAPRLLAMGFMAILIVPLMAWIMSPILWPVTPTRIKRYVESFEHAPLNEFNWRYWEIVAQWAIDSKLDPDLSKPRRLLAQEISGEQHPYILGSALRVGLLRADQVDQLKGYEQGRRSLVAGLPSGQAPEPIFGLAQEAEDWVIRAAVLRNDLSLEERDFVEQRLLATLEYMSKDQGVVLKTALRVTQLLDVIERPIDRDQYRETIHDLLRKFYRNSGSWGQIAGGFKEYLTWPSKWFGQPGSLEATAYAVELMEIYGVPDDLDLNWVRSFLRPLAKRKISYEQWIAAATLARLNSLSGVTRPTWLEVVYYERTLLAAVALVGLCIYATLSSPKMKPSAAPDGEIPPSGQGIVAGLS